MLIGTLLILVANMRHGGSALLTQFGIMSALWGVVDIGIAIYAWRTIAPRDAARATQLISFLWLNVGLDAGYAATGIALAACGWLLGRKLGLVGAGLAVVVQGLALLLLDLVFLDNIMAVMRSPI